MLFYSSDLCATIGPDVKRLRKWTSNDLVSSHCQSEMRRFSLKLFESSGEFAEDIVIVAQFARFGLMELTAMTERKISVLGWRDASIQRLPMLA
jgi:hypothetical protein